MDERNPAGILDVFADSVSAIGTQRFDAVLLEAINAIVAVDHLTILTWRAGEGLRILAVASRLDDGVARSLTRDFVATHHVLDPNFEELIRPGRSRKIIVRRHDPARLKTKRYQQRFYSTVGIVDKVSYLWRTGDGAYYANLYRTQRSGLYRQHELAQLSGIARFIASLVRMHGGRKRIEAALATGDTGELMVRLVGLLGESLTPREQAVLTRILMGMTTDGIALDLALKPASIITFRRRAYARLGIATQAELFSRCLRALPRLPGIG